MLIVIILIVILYFVSQVNGAALVSSKTFSKQGDNFILHIRVENIDEGLKVYRSIQYVGQKPIEISHHIPLISITFKTKKHEFTGKKVTKKLNNGQSYYPYGSLTFNSPKEGKHKLFIKARFSVKGEQKTISHVENLVFE